ncbi:recombinase family protein [bacterium]|nr:recombinase family protein [bacterium]
MADGRFIAYYRVSTKGQGQSGLGLEAQEAAVRQFLNGGDWQVLAEYTDVESGTRKGNERPELKRAIQHAQREKATLLIAKLDRLARNVHFVSGLMESRVDFLAADMPQANKLTIHILAAVAEAEAEAISARTKAALAAARERGTKLGNPKNLTSAAQAKGAQATRDKAITAYANQAGNIASLKQQGLSFRQIAAQLNERGAVTASGLPFQAMTVKRIYDRVIAEGARA